MNDLKILILGANGQLGKEFQKEFSFRNIDYLAPDKRECDITLFDNIRQFIENRKPDFIINCAAYNAVDNAESNSDFAYLINHKSVENLAKICKDNNIFLYTIAQIMFLTEEKVIYILRVILLIH